jgi:transposase
MWRHPPLTASRKPVGYLGLDPRVYQSSSSPAKGRRISKQGSPQARWAPVNPAWSVVQDPRLLHAFYERVRVRRGHQIGVVASARKARLLFWSLHRSEDHAHQQPSLTAKKLRLLEIRAGAKTLEGTNTGTWATRQKMRTAERALAEQAEASYQRFLIARGERILRVAPKHMFESWPESELV